MGIMVRDAAAMPNVAYEGPERESTWRRMAGASWDHPGDPTIYGLIDVDARAMQALIDQARGAGVRVTVTHVVARAVALAIGRHPELNVVYRRRRTYRRASVDVFLHAAVEGEAGAPAELSGVKIVGADRLRLPELAAEVERRVGRLKAREDDDVSRARRRMAATPRFLLGPLLRAVRHLSVEWNLDLRRLGVARDPFGSAAVTSVGMLGVDTGLAPLFPVGGPPIVITVGRVKPRAVVDEAGQVVARPILRLAGTFDHRVMDGLHLAALSRDVVRLLERDVHEL